MTITKYIGMDVHKESISIAVMNAAGKVVMECVIETKASMLLQFLNGLRGDVHVTFEEGAWAAWLYDLLKPHVSEVLVCNPRKNALLKDGSKSDRIDAHKRSWGIACTGTQVYAPRHRSEWLGRISEAGVRRRAKHCYEQLDAFTSVAPAGTPGSVAGKQEAPGMETAWPDSWDRPDPGGPVDRADPDPVPVPHQTTTVDL